MYRQLLLIVYFTGILTGAAQTNSDQTDSTGKNKIRKSYKDFFLDTNRQNYLFTAAAKYQNNIYSKSFTANGVYFHLGLNLFRFVSKELVFGPFFELKPINGFFYRQPRSGCFVRDFNNSFNMTFENNTDSATAYLLNERLNRTSIRGGNFANIGVMLSLFPNRNGGVMILLKKGGQTHRLGNVYGNTYISNGEADNLYFSFETYTVELMFKPYALTKNSYMDLHSEKKEDFRKSIFISVYYTRLNLKNASINGVDWTKIVDQSFISKYGITETIGLAFGCTLY